MKEWFLPAFLTFFLWGTWGFIPKLTTRYISPVSAVVFETVGVMMVGVVVLFVIGFRPDIHPKGIGFALFTGVCGILGALCYLTAISKGKVSVIVTMTALYPIFSISLAYLILKEPITVKEGVGMLFALVAIVLFAT